MLKTDPTNKEYLGVFYINSFHFSLSLEFAQNKNLKRNIWDITQKHRQ